MSLEPIVVVLHGPIHRAENDHRGNPREDRECGRRDTDFIGEPGGYCRVEQEPKLESGNHDEEDAESDPLGKPHGKPSTDWLTVP